MSIGDVEKIKEAQKIIESQRIRVRKSWNQNSWDTQDNFVKKHLILLIKCSESLEKLINQYEEK